MRRMTNEGPIRVVGVLADGAGVTLAAIHADGTRLVALGPVVRQGWDAAARAVLAGPAAAAREMAETVAATLLARLALPEGAAPGLIVLEAAAPGINPAVLAEVTGTPVAHDLRSADRRLGGAGHPLAPVFFHALAAHLGQGRITLLELGPERATLTQAAPEVGPPEAEGALCAFDTGPGLMLPGVAGAGAAGAGAAVSRRRRQGKVRQAVLRAALSAPFLARMAPRALGPQDFATLPDALAGLHPADAAATLRALVAETVASGVAQLPVPPDALIVCGPGAADRGVMTRLARALPCPVLCAEDTGLPAAEGIAAMATAFAGLRAARGMATTFPATTGVAACVGGAELAWPGMLLAGGPPG